MEFLDASLMLAPALPTTSWSAFIMAFFTPKSVVLDPAMSSTDQLAAAHNSFGFQKPTSDERIHSGRERDQNPKTLGSAVAQSLAR